MENSSSSSMLSGDTLALSSNQAHSSIQGFQFYLRTLEQFIASEKQKEIDQLSQKADKLNEELQQEFWAWHYPVHWEELFATQLRSSFLVTLVSLVESHLSAVAKEVHKIARAPLAPRELHGDHVERHRKYFHKVLAFQTPTNCQWNDISDLAEVRHSIVHAQSSIYSQDPTKKARLEQLAKKLKGTSIEYSVFQFSSEFPPFALERVNEFLSSLYIEAGRLLNRRVFWSRA